MIDDTDHVQNVFYDILDPIYRAGLACPLNSKGRSVKGFSIKCSKEDKTSGRIFLKLMKR
jgi:hypothetical protein